MGVFLIMAGFAVNAVSGIVILVKAFRVSVGWGLAVMFIPFASLYFVIKNWEATKAPFFAGLGGGALMMFGILGTANSVDATAPGVETVSSPRPGSSSAQPTYAAAAAPTTTSYEPPRSAYLPPVTHTPRYDPPPQPTPAVATDTQAEPEDEWQRKPVYEQVYVDRETGMFYAEKCKKRPANVYRIPRTVALMQGMPEAQCP
ncbi:MAG: hypothetical protein ACXW31_07505 [Thermoanaerobaculia bacterium]